MKKADNVQRKKCENVKTFRKPGESLLKTKQRNESWLKTVAQ